MSRDATAWKIKAGEVLPSWLLGPARSGYRAMHALVHAKLPPVFQNSVPKSGTHLMRSALVAVGYRFAGHQPFNPDVWPGPSTDVLTNGLARVRRGEFVTEHVAWSPEIEAVIKNAGHKVVLVYRDPRAVAVSFAHYARSHARFGTYFNALPDTHARITAVLEGISPGQAPGPHRAGLAELYDAFLPWRTSSLCVSVSFEDLIGTAGGGCDHAQQAALEKVFSFLGVGNPHGAASRVAGRVFDTRSATFRKGQIGAWREEIESRTVDLLNERLARQIQSWGYE